MILTSLFDELPPTEEEVRRWLLSTLRHSCQVEYYFDKLSLGHNDSQRPHDITGPGNKFEWEVLKGMALQYRSREPDFFDHYVMPSIRRHRENQYHHRMWNQPNPSATADDMKVGAVDMLCSLLDFREYQGGAHTFDQIIDVIKHNEPHKVKWMWMVYSEMKRIPQPDVMSIRSLAGFPNVGLPYSTYGRILYRTEEALTELRDNHGYVLES